MASTVGGGRRQDPAEAASCLPPEGPALVVAPWLRVVFEWERRDAAARLSTPELRLAVVQAFLCRGQGSGAISSTWDRSVAELLTACDTCHELWPLFGRSARAGVATNAVARAGPYSDGCRPRPLDPRARARPGGDLGGRRRNGL
jgi:hypothetical protein